MKKYKLKLDYTADELKELKELGKNTNSPINATGRIAGIDNNSDKFKNLQLKYVDMDYKDEFDFMADVNNVIMGTAIFPEKKYVVHDKVTDQYIYYSVKRIGLFWGQPNSDIAEIHTKEEWLKINPAYEAMLEKVED